MMVYMTCKICCDIHSTWGKRGDGRLAAFVADSSLLALGEVYCLERLDA